MLRFAARPFFFATVIVFGASGINAATAAPLPTAGWVAGSGVTFGNDTVPLTNPPSGTVSATGTGGSASLQFSATPTPSITATTQGFDAADGSGGFANGVFTYFGRVV